jgi:hypothetical protein
MFTRLRLQPKRKMTEKKKQKNGKRKCNEQKCEKKKNLYDKKGCCYSGRGSVGRQRKRISAARLRKLPDNKQNSISSS